MKKILLAAFAAIGMASCTGDDSPSENGPNPTPVDPVEKNLKSISYYGAYQDTPVLSHIIYFENNQPTEYHDNGPGAGGEMKVWEKYSYGSNGLLFRVERYNYETEEVEHRIFLEYDTQDRLVHYEDVSYNDMIPGGTHWHRYYTYNPDNTITCDYDPGGVVFDTFYLDSNGLIYKVTGNEFNFTTLEAVYSGGNMLSMLQYDSNWNGAIHYSYDMETEVKGHFLRKYRNQFGTQANMVLFNLGYYYIDEESDNFVTNAATENTTESYDFEYEFDADGYPIKRMKSFEGDLIHFEEIEYE